jgi:hypothetical protein
MLSKESQIEARRATHTKEHRHDAFIVRHKPLTIAQRETEAEALRDDGYSCASLSRSKGEGTGEVVDGVHVQCLPVVTPPRQGPLADVS